MKIYTLHGTVDKIDNTCMGHRNLVATDNLISYATYNIDKIGSLNEVLAGDKEIALTVDDNINAAYDCVSALAKHNIPVAWFVNSYNLYNNEEYSFAYLNSLMDCCSQDHFVFNQHEFILDNFRSRKLLRKKIKSFLHQNTTNEIERVALIEEIARNNNISIQIPSFSRSVGFDELKGVADSPSVSIYNHLDQHNFTDRLDLNTLLQNIELGESQLRKLGYESQGHCALPYGLYSESLLNIEGMKIYLLDNGYEAERITDNIINRIALQV